jgi:hypothetical protein
MTIDEMIAVLQAAKAGKKIQERSRTCQFLPPWADSPTPSWNFPLFDYRVKSEPRTIWVNEYGQHLATHSSKESALEAAKTNQPYRTAVKFVEVIE